MTTRWYHYLLAFCAAIFLTNFLPHFINGISGNPFPSPFTEPPGVGLSSPVENITWATINFLMGAALIYFGKLNQRHQSILIAYFIGALTMAFYLAYYFGELVM